jgi:cellulose synthase/poly-beta-1,6-N-acetylglucosamine synthase-like glycosyltransferase
MMFDRPATGLAILWTVWLLQAAWCCWNQWAFRSRVRRWNRRVARTDRLLFREPVVVITPIKGAYVDHAGHMNALLHQDYPEYRVLFVVESESDPACASLKPFCASLQTSGGGGCVEARVLVAGLASDEGQKVHNLLHALGHLTERDRAVVFADVDAVPDRHWLRHMVDQLLNDDVGVTTGYRWFVPPEAEEANLATRMASVLNSSVATLLGRENRSHAWGGSTAIRRDTLESADVAGHWRGALSDDYQMTRAMTLAGKRIVFLPICLIASPANFTWGSLLEFGRRQHLITRIHSPGIWLIGLAAMWVYTAGWLSAAAALLMGAHSWGWGVAAMIGVSVLDVVRGSQRRKNVVMTLGEDVAEKLRSTFVLDRFATPVWMALHAWIILSSAVGRRIRWAGIRYEMRGRQRVKILGRD